jgi:hypothetical protein
MPIGDIESTRVTHVPIVVLLHWVSMRHWHTLWSIPDSRACSQYADGGTCVENWCTSTTPSIPRSSTSTSTSPTISSIIVPSILRGYIDLVDWWGLPLLWLGLPWRDVLHRWWGIVLCLHWHTGLCRWWSECRCHVRWWHDRWLHGRWCIGLIHRHVGKLLE